MNDEDWLKKRRRGPGGGCAVLWVGLLLVAGAAQLTAVAAGPTVEPPAAVGRAPAPLDYSPSATPSCRSTPDTLAVPVFTRPLSELADATCSLGSLTMPSTSSSA